MKLVGLLSNISAWWHVAGVLIIVAVLWILPEKHQSVSLTLTGFHNETGWTFLPYVFLMGLLMAQYTFTGYDASAHVSEETKNASRAAPRGIVMSVLVSLIAGFILLFSITAAIPDGSEEGLTALAASETGLPPAQIFLDSLGPDLAKFLLFIVCVAQFLCGMASVTANSRMTYAFSRDNALPGSRIWAKVNPKTGTPTNSIWLCVVLSIILASPALISSVAYLAVTSIAVIGLYIAYVAPVFLRRIRPDFQPGPWNLGRYSAPVGWIAVVWVAFICVLFVLPPASPVTLQTFNYAPVAVIVVVIIALVAWQAWGKKHLHARRPGRAHDQSPRPGAQRALSRGPVRGWATRSQRFPRPARLRGLRGTPGHGHPARRLPVRQHAAAGTGAGHPDGGVAGHAAGGHRGAADGQPGPDHPGPRRRHRRGPVPGHPRQEVVQPR